MPLYEYRCEGCGEIFEVMQKFADEPLTVHEKCGAPVRRLLSAPALQFKGTGWYVTDYARGGSSGKSDSEKKSLTESGANTETKSSESKSGDSKSSDSKSSGSKPASSDKSKSD